MMGRKMKFFVIALFVFGVPSKALAVNPLYKTYLNSGWEARKAKNYTKAEKYYIGAVQLNPRSSDPKIGLLYTYIESGDFLKAEDMVEPLLVTHPENLWVRKGAAWIFYNRRRYDDAIVQYSYILNTEGHDPEMKLGLGLSQYYAGRKREAKKTCRECMDHFDENDQRIMLCLGKEDVTWVVTPNGFLSYTDYTDSVSKQASATLTAGLEIFHTSGVGVYLQGSGMGYSQKETGDTYQEYTSSLALFYSQPLASLRANWTRVDGNYEGEESANIFSLYGSKRFGEIHLGGEATKSIYDGFHINQYQPEIGFYLGDHYLVKLSSMIQKSSGETASSLTEMKTRYSSGLDISATYDPVSIGLSGYYGERWYTAEDKGLHIWNADEEFEWGGKLTLGFHSDKRRSHYLSFRVDKAFKQFGLENDFYVLGISTGMSINF